MSKKCTCTKCKTIHEWNYRRRVVGGVVGGLTGSLSIIFWLVFNSFIFALILVVMIDLAVMVLTPGQYKIIEKPI